MPKWNPIAIIAFTIVMLTPPSGQSSDRWSPHENQVGSSRVVADGTPIEAEECLVRFADEVEVPALESGRVKQVAVRLNDVVLSQDPLGSIDDRSLLIRRRSAVLRYESAKDLASDNVEIQFAQVTLAEAKEELQNSRDIQSDAGGAAIPLTRLRQQRLAVERAELEVAQAKKRQQRAIVEAQLREADLAVIDDQLNHLKVESPIDGIALDVLCSAGEWIEKGETFAKLGQIDRLHIHALVRSEALSPRHCRGLPVSVHWKDPHDDSPRALRGQILSVDPQSLPGGRFRVHAEIQNQKVAGGDMTWMLTPGTDVRMRIYVSSISSKSPRLQPLTGANLPTGSRNHR